jgi:pimeloyl-ACP methyl ester carboxylesterase
MSYASTRDSEQLRLLDPAIADFIFRYNSAPPNPSRRTLFLFPGGMGCQLLRAQTPYQDGVAGPQTFSYDKVWLTLETFLGDALTLAMHQDGQQVYRDLDDRIIVAEGAVEFLGVTPYDGFTAWCEAQNIDWFVFGWDWRRRLEETTDFFLGQFLPHFQSAVSNACNADPLQNFVLVGHSFGGMIVNLAVRSGNPVLNGMSRAVTVAAPFYGYGGQVHRYFEGEPLLNWLGTDAVVEVITSLPACYTLLYLDGGTYTTWGAALGGNPYPLQGYPSVDAANSTQTVDDYNCPVQRYPATIGFNDAERQHALAIYQKLVAPLPASVAGKFYCIRGIKAGTADTAGSISWGAISNTFDPATGPSPISDGSPVEGDGTQPAWTTRLVATGSNPSIDVVANDVEHMFIMEAPETQNAVAQALGLPPVKLMKAVRLSRKRAKLARPATRKRAADFIAQLRARSGATSAAGIKEYAAAIESQTQMEKVEEYVDRLSQGSLQSIGRRILMDIMKAPPPRRGGKRGGAGRKQGGRRPKKSSSRAKTHRRKTSATNRRSTAKKSQRRPHSRRTR